MNNIVSGALDRLHYESDPCVKYDSDRKLWIYLHRERSLDDQIWDCSLKTVEQIQKSTEIIWPNCMDRNAIHLDKVLTDSNREKFSGLFTEENLAKWRNSVHKEQDTAELKQLMESLAKRQKELLE